jgi:predicted DNA-binding mobile mystery protein A
MSSKELATRMGVTQPAVIGIERSELHDTIKLETLRRAADALDCELVYFLMPRTSLEESVERQARYKAAQYLQPVVHNSRLENQATTNEENAEQLAELATQLIDRRGLWNETGGAT